MKIFYSIFDFVRFLEKVPLNSKVKLKTRRTMIIKILIGKHVPTSFEQD